MIPSGFNARNLQRTRVLNIEIGRNSNNIPATPPFAPLTRFVEQKERDYAFCMLDLLHVAGVKMLAGRILRGDVSSALFATGGLYLALDQVHKSLAFDRSFGDFTSGFSHQFGVALACMSLSEAYSVPWDQMVPIPVKGKKSLDYEVKCPEGMWLKLEAKGVSTATRSSARASIGRKKMEMRKDKSADSANVAMIGVIAQTAGTSNTLGVIEFVDPEFEPNLEARREHNQRAGRLLHYATLAAFAGLRYESAQLIALAMEQIADQNRASGDLPWRVSREDQSDSQFIARINGHDYAGIQWRLDDHADQGIWVFHGIDHKILRNVLELKLPDTEPFRSPEPSHSPDEVVSQGLDASGSVYSVMPDGSFFGIGLNPIDGFRVINRRHSFG